MKEPKKIPLTDYTRIQEPKRIPLTIYPECMTDDLWEKVETNHSPPIFARKNHENNLENNSQSIQELESD